MSVLVDRQPFAKGYTSMIYHHQEPSKVIKVLVGENAKANFDAEYRAYERLLDPERPSSILQYFGIDDYWQYGLVLELASKGDLHGFIWQSSPIDSVIKCRLARQAIEALMFVHSKHVLHCDVHAINFFLDLNHNIKLGDFGAASIDGERPQMMYRSSHQLWVADEHGKWRRDFSVASDIFALGCVLYNVETCNGLFAKDGEEIEHDKIVQKLKSRDYPELDNSFMLEKVIGKCWMVQYSSTKDILIDLPQEKAFNAPTSRMEE